MRKIYCLFLISFCIFAFCGCSKDKYAGVTGDTLYVSKGEKVTLVSFFELSNYGGLYSFEVADDNRMIEYNYSIEGIGVWRESDKIEDDKIKVVSGFDDFLSYAGYIGVKFFSGTIKEALIAFDIVDYTGSFIDYSTGEVISAEDVIADKSLNIIILDQDIDVEIKGKIVYYSDNVELKDEDSVRTSSSGLCYIIFK